ncbi:MAG: class I SAM-dependent rRNA methyltransferase [Bacteroidetes bacterium]|nr:MAG: class I SAM-dependent rRNA methyltransferase [Bacteroidota bacterium]
METISKIILKPGKDEAIKRFHPWVFSGAIKNKVGSPTDGGLVEVFSHQDEYLGTGLFQDASIAVRIMAFAPERPQVLDAEYWYSKLFKAWKLRVQLGLTSNESTNVYRLIHGEGDQLPGLIIDHYNGNLVIQAHAIGIHQNIHLIAEGLKSIYGSHLKSIYYKSTETLPGNYARNEDTEGFLFGENATDVVFEYGHKFEIDFVKGQKTGFFIDQRENRQLLARYSKGKKVLNTFCYSGGFSVYALQAGAAYVESLDSSKRAIELTEKNVELNFPGCKNHEVIVADAVQYIRESDVIRDVIILDPPAFAKHTNVRHNAVQGYKRLNAEAIRRIAPGGILFTFSCSQVVNMSLFKSTIMAAAIEAGRQAKILHQMSQPADHPVNAFHPEGEYLKGLVLYIE